MPVRFTLGEAAAFANAAKAKWGDALRMDTEHVECRSLRMKTPTWDATRRWVMDQFEFWLFVSRLRKFKMNHQPPLTAIGLRSGHNSK